MLPLLGINMYNNSIYDLLIQIKQDFPDLKINNFYVEETGWMNTVIIVNKNIVFRFPKTSRMEEKLKKEINLLSILKNCPVRIPEYTFISNAGHMYGGYLMINGIALNTSKSLGAGLIQNFNALLNYMKSFNRSDLYKINIPVYDEKSWQNHEEDLIKMFSGSLDNFIGRDYFDNLLNMMENAFCDLSPDDFSLIHGDLSGNNVLINKRHNKINGVIDWADSCYGDTALDIAAIVDDFSVKYALQLSVNHNSEFGNRLMKRALTANDKYYIVMKYFYKLWRNFTLSGTRAKYCRFIQPH
jgi:aminoglycoside 2''-phosphotransferase